MPPAVMGPPAQASDADLPALPCRAAPSAATAAQRAGSGMSSFSKRPTPVPSWASSAPMMPARTSPLPAVASHGTPSAWLNTVPPGRRHQSGGTFQEDSGARQCGGPADSGQGSGLHAGTVRGLAQPRQQGGEFAGVRGQDHLGAEGSGQGRQGSGVRHGGQPGSCGVVRPLELALVAGAHAGAHQPGLDVGIGHRAVAADHFGAGLLHQAGGLGWAQVAHHAGAGRQRAAAGQDSGARIVCGTSHHPQDTPGVLLRAAGRIRQEGGQVGGFQPAHRGGRKVRFNAQGNHLDPAGVVGAGICQQPCLGGSEGYRQVGGEYRSGHRAGIGVHAAGQVAGHGKAPAWKVRACVVDGPDQVGGRSAQPAACAGAQDRVNDDAGVGRFLGQTLKGGFGQPADAAAGTFKGSEGCGVGSACGEDRRRAHSTCGQEGGGVQAVTAVVSLAGKYHHAGAGQAAAAGPEPANHSDGEAKRGALHQGITLPGSEERLLGCADLRSGVGADHGSGQVSLLR